jgi:hypothetical protein
MTDALDAIPEDAIYLLDAFERVFQKQTPRWQVFGRRCDAIKLALLLHQENPLYTEKCQKVLDKALVPFDRAQFRANEWLRLRISDGALTAYIRNPVTDKLFQLPRTGWDCRTLTKSAIVSNFVGPDDMDAPGPDTVVAGARRPVFFKTAEIEQLLLTGIELNSKRKRPGRPSFLPIVEAQLDWLILNPPRVLHRSRTAAAKSLIVWFEKANPRVKAPDWKTVRNELSEKLEKITKAQNLE